MAVTQLQARVYSDGSDKQWATAGLGNYAVELGSAPNCHVDRIYLARFEIEDTVSESLAFQLERRLNTGSWGDANATSTVAKITRSPSNEDAAATENKLTGSALTFVAGEHDNANGATSSISFSPGNRHTEVQFAFYIPSADVSDGDTVQLRCYVSSSGDLDTYSETITCTALYVGALPGLISVGEGHVAVESISFTGPICDTNGSLYVFGEGGHEYSQEAGAEGHQLTAWKSADGGKRWLPVKDLAGSHMQDVESLSIVRGAPNTTGEYWMGIGTGGDADMEHIIFYASDHASTPDTWGSDTGQRGDVASAAVGEDHVGLNEMADGDLFAAWGLTVSTYEQVIYDYQVSGTWQGTTPKYVGVLSVNSSEHYTCAKVSLGSNRSVVCYHNITNQSIEMRAVSTGGTLYPSSTETQVNTVNVALDGSSGSGNNGATDGAIIDVLCYDTTNDYHLVVYLVTDGSDELLAANTLKWSGTAYDVGDEQILSHKYGDIDYPNGLDANAITGGSMAVDQETGFVYVTYCNRDDPKKFYGNWWDPDNGWVREIDSDDFTGTNGDAWDTDRWTDDSTGSGVVDIQSNQGRLQYSTGYGRAYSNAIYGETIDIVFSMIASDTSGDMQIGFIKGTTWDATPHLPQDGYGINITAYGTPTTWENIAGTYGALSSFGSNPGTSKYWYRLLYDGTYVRAKMWSGSRAGEGAVWNAKSAADDLRGDVFRVFAAGATNGSTNHSIDDLEIRVGNERVLWEPDEGAVDLIVGHASSQVFTHSEANGGSKVFGYTYKLYDETAGEDSANLLYGDWIYNEVNLEAPGSVPTYKATDTDSWDTAGTAFTIDYYNGTSAAQGDLVIVHAVADQSTGKVTATGAPFGWTKLLNTSVYASYASWAYWKVMTAYDISQEVATWYVATGDTDFAASIHVYTAGTFDPANPIGQVAYAEVETSAVSPRIVTSGTNRHLLFLAGADDTASGETMSSDLGSEVTDTVLTGDYIHVAGYTLSAATMGVYQPTITSTESSDQFHGLIVEINPAFGVAPVVAGVFFKFHENKITVVGGNPP